jgi:hypothetical protein
MLVQRQALFKSEPLYQQFIRFFPHNPKIAFTILKSTHYTDQIMILFFIIVTTTESTLTDGLMHSFGRWAAFLEKQKL